MTTKEFIKKFNLNEGWKRSKTNEFIKELGNSLRELLEGMKVSEDIKKFNECVKQVRSKFEGISNKTPYGIPEEVWNYFYKKEVISLRDEFCPEVSKAMKEEYKAEGLRRKEEAKIRQQEYEAQKKSREEEKEWRKSHPKPFIKLVSITDTEVFYKTHEGDFKTTREDFDKDFIVKDGKILPNDDYHIRLEKIEELLNGAATDFIMSRAKNSDSGQKLTFMLMFGSRIEEIQKLDNRLSILDITKLIRQRINLVVGPGWWDAIKDE